MRHAAYVFDAYGTLFDVHAAVRRHAGEIGPEGQRFSELWRAKQLEYSWVFTLMGEYTDFWTMTERSISPSQEFPRSTAACGRICSTPTGSSTVMKKFPRYSKR